MRFVAFGLLVLVLGAAGLQAFDTPTVDRAEVGRFLDALGATERLGQAIVRAPHQDRKSVV